MGTKHVCDAETLHMLLTLFYVGKESTPIQPTVFCNVPYVKGRSSAPICFSIFPPGIPLNIPGGFSVQHGTTSPYSLTSVDEANQTVYIGRFFVPRCSRQHVCSLSGQVQNQEALQTLFQLRHCNKIFECCIEPPLNARSRCNQKLFFLITW